MVRQPLKNTHRLFAVLAVAIFFWPSTAHAQDEVVYYHTDAIGSVRMVTDAAGAVIARYDYLPFGERWDSPPNPNPDVRQFTAKERDAETKLDYFGARYYRPISGNFTTVDPGHAAGSPFDPQSWNAYAYALNNPFRFVDLFGLAPCPAPTDSSTCVEGRRGTGDFAVDFALWLLEAWVRSYVDAAREEWNNPSPIKYGTMPAPPFFRGLTAGSIRNVNPIRGLLQLRPMENCVNCAIATDLTLAGRAASAVPSGETSIEVLEQWYGTGFVPMSGRAAIEAELMRAGPGARGIIFGYRGPLAPGHVFNGVNQGGFVRFLDGQIGGPASFEGYRSFKFLRTW